MLLACTRIPRIMRRSEHAVCNHSNSNSFRLKSTWSACRTYVRTELVTAKLADVSVIPSGIHSGFRVDADIKQASPGWVEDPRRWEWSIALLVKRRTRARLHSAMRLPAKAWTNVSATTSARKGTTKEKYYNESTHPPPPLTSSAAASQQSCMEDAHAKATHADISHIRIHACICH